MFLKGWNKLLRIRALITENEHPRKMKFVDDDNASKVSPMQSFE